MYGGGSKHLLYFGRKVPKERNHTKELGLDLKEIGQQGMTGLICLRIGRGSGLFWTW
jgi:hypothetical protein